MYNKVKDFQLKFFFEEVSLTPRILPEAREAEILDHVYEEIEEIFQAKTIEDKFDGIIDAVYVLMGLATKMGLQRFEEGFRRVHEANMQKVRGQTARGYAADVRKPDGWVAPDLKDLVE
jgi:predicted HAD superfamily Cof-like phosphohydrolase